MLLDDDYGGNGPEEPAHNMQATLKRIVNVNWVKRKFGGGGEGGNKYSAKSDIIREMGKDLCLRLIQPVVENINRRSRN